MEKKFLNKNTYDFYRKFKDYSAKGILSEVVIGSKNKKIKLKNGKDLKRYEGSQAKELVSRISRRSEIDKPDTYHVSYPVFCDGEELVYQGYKDWNIERLRKVLDYMRNRGLIKRYTISKQGDSYFNIKG